MTFKLEHGTYTELYTRQDVANLLRALKLSDVVLGVLQREIDSRLAWGEWPGEPDKENP